MKNIRRVRKITVEINGVINNLIKRQIIDCQSLIN